MGNNFTMIDVGEKPVTRRIACARGEIKLSPTVLRAIIDRRLPKGDVSALAEVAGIFAAKSTSGFLPLCHPLTLDAIDVTIETDIENGRVCATCTVSSSGKTGVEMEALSGVNGALLCIYDLTKSLDKGAVIGEIKLLSKSGGKSGFWSCSESSSESPGTIGRTDLYSNEPATATAPSGSSRQATPRFSGLSAAVITVSDRCFCGSAEDRSGPLLAGFLRKHGADVNYEMTVADELRQIQAAVKKIIEEGEIQFVVLTGGSGPAPRDLTPEALAPLWSKELPGFGELYRSRGLLKTERAWLSRATAGIVQRSVVVVLPGSPAAVADSFDILLTSLPHLVEIAAGGGHRA